MNRFILSLFALVLCFAALAEDAVTVAEKKYNAAVDAAKKEFVKALTVEKDRLTKAGDLDGAVKIRDRIAALEPTKEGVPPAAGRAEITINESMGYKITILKQGVSSHTNAANPWQEVPTPLVGKKFTQVPSGSSGPIKVKFKTDGTAFVLVSPNFDQAPKIISVIDQIGKKESVTISNGNPYDVWSITGHVGQEIDLPVQTVLVADDITKGK